MSSKLSKIKIFIIANLFLILAINFIQAETQVLLFLILLYYIFIFTIVNQKIGLFLIILFRPCLDIFTNTNNNIFYIVKISINISSVIGIISIILAIITIYKNRAEKLPFSIAWFLFLGTNLLSLFFSIDKIVSVKEIIRLLSIFLIYISSFYLIKNKKDFVLLVKIIIFSSIIPSALSIYQYVTNTGLSIPMENIYNRIYGTFAHPNLFAYYLIIPITLSMLVFLIGKKERIINIIMLFFSIFLTIILGLTYTRGAWLALMITIFVIGIIQYRILLISAVIVFIMSYIFIGSIQNRIDDLYKAPKGNSIEWRQNLWRDSFTYISQKPIIGYGSGLANKIILEKRGERMGSADPHNDYLKIAIENGFIGLLSYLFLASATLFYLIKNYLKTEQKKLKAINLTIISLFFSLLIASFADNIIRNTVLQWLIWILIGGIMRINYPKTENKVLG